MATPVENAPAKSGGQILKMRRVGNSVGITFPKDVLARHGLAEGSVMHVVETSDGLLLTPYDPHFAEVIEAYEEVEEQYKNAFRELAR